MLSFLGMSKTSPNKIGDLRENKNVGEQLFELKGRMEKTMSKSKSELQNYRELSKFNEQLAKSYSVNLNVIVEISRMLNAYNEFFDLFKQKLGEIDKELGIPISSDDFEYMKKLTNEQMFQLDEVFKRETSNLKKMYSKYGKQKEYDDVDTAERLFEETKNQGIATITSFKRPDSERDTTPQVYAKSFANAKVNARANVKANNNVNVTPFERQERQARPMPLVEPVYGGAKKGKKIKPKTKGQPKKPKN